MKIDLRSIYRFAPMDHLTGQPLPKGGDIYYECVDCNGVVSSVSHAKAACECGNLSGGGGETVVKATEKVRPMRGKLR
jgi:hypothetical protein